MQEFWQWMQHYYKYYIETGYAEVHSMQRQRNLNTNELTVSFAINFKARAKAIFKLKAPLTILTKKASDLICNHILDVPSSEQNIIQLV